MAMIFVGFLYAAISAAIVSWLWPGMGLFAFLSFVVGWGVGITNTVALQRRHPELVLPAEWKWVRPRYKPLELGENDYEITLFEFIRGQVEVIIMGVPLSLFLAGLAGLLWPSVRWEVFGVAFGLWTILMVFAILNAIKRGRAQPESSNHALELTADRNETPLP